MAEYSSIVVGEKESFRTLILFSSVTKSATLIQLEEENISRIWIPEKDRNMIAELLKLEE